MSNHPLPQEALKTLPLRLPPRRVEAPDGSSTKANHVYKILAEQRVSKFEPFWMYYAAVAITLLLPVVLSTLTHVFESSQLVGRCLPGSDQALTGTFRLWSARYVLDITLGMGQLTFSQAKSTDICWDLFVGRGGQAVLAFIAYRVLSRTVLYLMERDKVTCRSYSAVAFRTGSLHGTWDMLADFGLGRFVISRYGVLAYGAMVACSSYVLVYPTLASAATSYGAITTLAVAVDDRLIPLTEWEECWAVVADGSRVGLIDGYVVGLRDSHSDNGKVPWEVPSSVSAADAPLYEYVNVHRYQYSQYESSYLADLLDDTNRIASTGPASNHTELNLYSYISLNGHEYTLEPPLLNIMTFGASTCWYQDSPRTFVNSDQLNSGTFGVCVPTKVYQWGFSFLLLFTICALNACFIGTLTLMLWYTDKHSQKGRLHRYQPHMWRAVVDLSNVARMCGRDDVYGWDTDHLKKVMEEQWMSVRYGANLGAEWDDRGQYVEVGESMQHVEEARISASSK